MIEKIRFDQSGATAVEYGLLISLIVLGMLVGLSAFADSTEALWTIVRTRTLNGLGN